MKLLVDMHVFDYGAAGVNTFLTGIYREMIAQNPDITFYFASHNQSVIDAEFGIHENVKLIKIPNVNRLWRLGVTYPYIIHKYKIDVAHFQYVLPLFRGCREVVTMHDILFEEFPEMFPRLYRFARHWTFLHASRRADLVTTCSNASRRAIERIYHINRDKIMLTPNAVSREFIDHVKNASGDIKNQYGVDRYILFVSRKEPRKNHITLVKAYNELKLWEKGISLVLVGGTSIEVPELQNYIASICDEARKHIIMLEHIAVEELYSWYKGADLFVYPSLAEGFGIPPIEAAACKIPTICSNVTAMEDFTFLGNGHIAPDDINALKNQISNFLTQRNDIVLEQIQKTILKTYNWKKIAADFSTRIKAI